MFKSPAIVWYFYRSLLLWHATISLVCIYYIHQHKLTIFASVFLKLASYGFAVGYQHYNFSANKTFFYFRNAGYTIRRLYLYMFSIDIVIYAALLSLSFIP
ncbi:MAG: hypothetical protein JWR38_3760 [Mucilaginibacter sp.]|nr:hypothetical protein [Mucilaginibacter sp.]